MILELLDAGRRFNKTWIFRHLNLKLETPDTLAVLGPNGSGKSTLMMLLAGHLSPSEGRISFTDQGKAIENTDFFKCISFAGPSLELIEEFTLEELLDFQISLKGSYKNIGYSELITRSGLEHAGKKQIRLFSSGMKQRVKLLLACSSNTPVLLLDEPLMNLDEQGVLWYKEMLDFYVKDRIVIVASNNIREYDFCREEISITAYK
jgi:ABC-type multidrug transport system ATPase subunit